MIRPRDLHISTRFLDQGDRFIPTRSLMDIERAQSLLMPMENRKTSKPSVYSPAREEYMRKVEENLSTDSEGRPLRMLVFRGSPRNCRKNRLDLKEEDQDSSVLAKRYHGLLPMSADRVLDGPELIDDYYLNILDWGRNNILAVALGDSLYLWNEATSKVTRLFTRANEEDYPASVAWADDQKTLAIGFAGSVIELWDVVTSCKVQSIEKHTGKVGSLSWNHNILTSGSHDRSIINHDVRLSGRPASYYRGHSGDVCGLRWSEGGKLLASGGNDNLVHVWESSNASGYLYRFGDHSAAVRALAWCPHHENFLASGGGTLDRCIKIWSMQSGKCVNSVDTGAQVCALEWNRHQKEILSAHGFSQFQLSLWAYPSMSKIADFNGHTARVLHLSQNPDGSTVVSAAADETIRLWKIFRPPPSSSKFDDESDSPLSLKKMHIR